MAITKLRVARNKEQTCFDCGTAIKIGQEYHDSDEKLDGKKPFPTAKRCRACGDKILEDQKA